MKSTAARYYNGFWVNDDIEHDGRVVNTSRDPPGQQSVYILPGNQEEESYRVTTFTKFPMNAPVDTRKLAENGFCYTGYKDRVKCFSCGVQVESWHPEDDPKARTWHFLNCEFYTGVPNRNKPTGNRLRLLVHQTTSNPNQRRSSPVRNVTRSPSAGSIGSFSSNSAGSAGSFSSNSAGVVGSYSANSSPRHHHPIGVTANPHTSNQSANSEEQVNQQDLQEIFPCQHPINPHMRHSNSRLATYEVGWQTSRVRASPRELADSGLYFLGIRDKVKCWYCNGGLQNWDYDDEPWFEHAKWFPTCEFLLQRKGPQFVHRIVAQFPNLRRPTIRNPSRRQAISGLDVQRFHSSHQRISSTRLMRSQRQTLLPETPVQIIDPKEEMKKLKKRVTEEMRKSSELVANAREMGFERKQIKAAFKRKLKSTNTSFSLFGDLVETMLNQEGDLQSDSDSDSEGSEATGAQTSSPSSSTSQRSAVEEVRQLEEEKLCKICRVNNVQVVFLPCGHLVSCLSCSPNTANCPICKALISDRVRTYPS